MKYCFILSIQGGDTVYRNLRRLMSDLGRLRQYQTFRRALAKNEEMKLGDVTIKRAIFITSTRS